MFEVHLLRMLALMAAAANGVALTGTMIMLHLLLRLAFPSAAVCKTAVWHHSLRGHDPIRRAESLLAPVVASPGWASMVGGRPVPVLPAPVLAILPAARSTLIPPLVVCSTNRV